MIDQVCGATGKRRIEHNGVAMESSDGVTWVVVHATKPVDAIDEARKALVLDFRAHMGNDEYSDYIRTFLAGDFAVELARVLAEARVAYLRTAPVVPDAAYLINMVTLYGAESVVVGSVSPGMRDEVKAYGAVETRLKSIIEIIHAMSAEIKRGAREAREYQEQVNRFRALASAALENDDLQIIAASNRSYAAGVADGKALGALSAQAAAPVEPLQVAAEEMARMLESGEWAEHVATFKAPGNAVAMRLESAITDALQAAQPVEAPAKSFEEWASEPCRTEKLPLDKHANGAYSDRRSYLVHYGWVSAMRHGAPGAAPRKFTGDEVAALRVAGDVLIERYAAPIRAILANAEQVSA